MFPMTEVSRLLKSCATPPVSLPIASMFCDCSFPTSPPDDAMHQQSGQQQDHKRQPCADEKMIGVRLANGAQSVIDSLADGDDDRKVRNDGVAVDPLATVGCGVVDKRA